MSQIASTDSALEIGHATEHGAENPANDDAYLIFPAYYRTDPQSSATGHMQVALIADGVGENGSGRIASQLAIEKIYTTITESLSLHVHDRLVAAIKSANAEFHAQMRDDPSLESMRSSVIAAAVFEGKTRKILIPDLFCLSFNNIARGVGISGFFQRTPQKSRIAASLERQPCGVGIRA